MTISAIILTRNEELNIEDCLSSVAFADEKLVVDSGSIDQTVTLAEKLGARVVTRAFADFASQRNFAMAEAQGDWILFLDADERVTQALAEEIKEIAQANPGDVIRMPRNLTKGIEFFEGPCVYAIPRHNFFFGRRLRFSDARDDAPVRLFPRAGVRWFQPVHEKIATEFPTRELKSPILHYSTRDLVHYKQKIRDYIPLELETMRTKGLRPSLIKALFLPSAKFVQLYFLQLGFLDGLAGFQYAILSAYFYTFQKYWLYWKQQ